MMDEDHAVERKALRPRRSKPREVIAAVFAKMKEESSYLNGEALASLHPLICIKGTWLVVVVVVVVVVVGRGMSR